MSEISDFINLATGAISALENFVENGGSMANQAEIKAAIIEALEESASRFLAG